MTKNIYIDISDNIKIGKNMYKCYKPKFIIAPDYFQKAYNDFINNNNILCKKYNFEISGLFYLKRLCISNGESTINDPIYIIYYGDLVKNNISLIIDITNFNEIIKMKHIYRKYFIDTLYLAKSIYKIYYDGFQFPKWSLQYKLYHKYDFNRVMVFYNKTDNLNDVIKLVIQREPCNIGMKRCYDNKLLNKLFGWSYGAYDIGMPNIAIYCYTDIITPKKKNIKVNIINLIGYAFDDINQPDFISFSTDVKIIIEKYEKMWLYVYSCAIKLNIKKVHIFNVGGGTFAGHLTGKFVDTIFVKAFNKTKKLLIDNNIQIIGENDIINGLQSVKIPFIFDDLSQNDVNDILYINAWDPWSLIGNGNNSDKSLDGFFGRSSNLAILGWYITNPYMKFYSVDHNNTIKYINSEKIDSIASKIISKYNGSIINKFKNYY